MMLIDILISERIKLRRSPIWLPFFILPLIAAVMGTFNYQQNLGVLTGQWNSLWTQHTLFSSFFFTPALIALLGAYEWRLEHLQHNWNTFMTMPVSPWLQFVGKLLILAAMAALTQLLTGALFIISGKVSGLPGLPDLAVLCRNLFFGTVAAVGIASVQLLLSMLIRGFALPAGIALAGSIIGLILTSRGLSLGWPYALLAMGMNANGRNLLNSENILLFCCSCLLFTLLPLLLSVLRLRQGDIRT